MYIDKVEIKEIERDVREAIQCMSCIDERHLRIMSSVATNISLAFLSVLVDIRDELQRMDH